jgi:hypothetical protein
MERHIQTAIQLIILAVIMWIGNTVVALRDSSAVLTTQITELKSQVTDINLRFNGYMPRAETEAKFDLESSKHSEINRRLDSVEREIGTAQ